MRELKIQFKKGKHGVQHSVRLERSDGSCEWSYIRTLVQHDLAHYVVESHFHIVRGFYGEILLGTSMDTLTAASVTKAHNWHPDIFLAEALVNAFQQSLQLEDDIDVMAAAKDSLAAQGLLVPKLKREAIRAVKAKILHLWQEWEMLAPGQSLRLTFTMGH